MTSWRDLLEDEAELTLPWAGGREVYSTTRTWTVEGSLPPEYGWYPFSVKGRRARWKKELGDESLSTPPEFLDLTKKHLLTGYVVGDRFISDKSRVDPDPAKLIDQTETIYCVEPGLERFARATAWRDRGSRLIFLYQEWTTGPEGEVLAAYQDKKLSVDQIAGVTPSLELAFHWLTWGRARAEELEREAERQRQEEAERRQKEERLQEAMKNAGTGAGRRELARHDFTAAARAALAISGAELLDARPSYNKDEMVVQYRFQHRRLECVVDKLTLRVIEAGFCLSDHNTGVKGDTFFTLESIIPVLREALDTHKLVVWRHVPGDEDYGDGYNDDDD